MPRIPGYRADLQRELRGPYETVSANPNAGIAAAAVDNVAKAGFNYAQREQAYEDAKNKEKQNIDLITFQQEMKYDSDNLANESFKNAQPNGDGLVDYYDRNLDKVAQARIKKIQDPIAQQKAYASYLDIKNDKRSSLMGESRKMFNNHANEVHEMNMNVASARVMSNPNNFDKEFADYQKGILNSQYTPEAKFKSLRLGQESMANSAIDGLINAGEYDEAKSRLVNKFGPMGIYDQEKMSKLVDRIDSEKAKALDLSIKAEEREEKVFKESTEKRKDKNFLDMYAKVTEMNSVDLNNPGKGKSIEGLNTQIDQMVSSNDLRFAEAQHLKRFLNNEKSEDQATVSLDLYAKLSKGGNLKTLKDEVLKASASKSISPQTAQSLLGKIDAESDKRQRRLGKGASSTRAPMLKEAEGLINDHFKYGKYQAPFGPERMKNAELEAETKGIFYDLYYNNPKYKSKPLEAARAALKRTIPTYEFPNTLPVKKKEVMESPEQSAAKIKAKYLKGEIDKKTYLNSLLAINNAKLEMKRGN